MEWLLGLPEGSRAKRCPGSGPLPVSRVSATHPNPAWHPKPSSLWPPVPPTLHQTVPRAAPEPPRSPSVSSTRYYGEAPVMFPCMSHDAPLALLSAQNRSGLFYCGSNDVSKYRTAILRATRNAVIHAILPAAHAPGSRPASRVALQTARLRQGGLSRRASSRAGARTRTPAALFRQPRAARHRADGAGAPAISGRARRLSPRRFADAQGRAASHPALRAAHASNAGSSSASFPSAAISGAPWPRWRIRWITSPGSA